MVEIRQTTVFSKWLDNLADIQAKARIMVRIERLAMGNPGDTQPVGSGVMEMRIDYGPGYRVYYKHKDPYLLILLAGGNKGTQNRDIHTALLLSRNLCNGD